MHISLYSPKTDRKTWCFEHSQKTIPSQKYKLTRANNSKHSQNWSLFGKNCHVSGISEQQHVSAAKGLMLIR